MPAKDQPAVPVSDRVTVRVLKKGHGKISTGEHVPSEGELHHDFADQFETSRAIAEHLEERGYAEIQ